MSLVASGTVRVRSLTTGEEWDEIVEVFEADLEDSAASSRRDGAGQSGDSPDATDGSELTPEDVARRVARHQAGEQVETLECDLS
jgi:hypothetical protein